MPALDNVLRSSRTCRAHVVLHQRVHRLAFDPRDPTCGIRNGESAIVIQQRWNIFPVAGTQEPDVNREKTCNDRYRVIAKMAVFAYFWRSRFVAASPRVSLRSARYAPGTRSINRSATHCQATALCVRRRRLANSSKENAGRDAE